MRGRRNGERLRDSDMRGWRGRGAEGPMGRWAEGGGREGECRARGRVKKKEQGQKMRRGGNEKRRRIKAGSGRKAVHNTGGGRSQKGRESKSIRRKGEREKVVVVGGGKVFGPCPPPKGGALNMMGPCEV